MIIALFLTAAAFVIIFVAVGGYSEVISDVRRHFSVVITMFSVISGDRVEEADDHFSDSVL